MLGHGHYTHGANHLLMGAGSATMALAMATGNHGLHQASSVLMGAHGLMEVGLGVQSFLKAESGQQKALAATTALHGACLAGAQVAGSALALPLYLGMGAATVAQLVHMYGSSWASIGASVADSSRIRDAHRII